MGDVWNIHDLRLTYGTYTTNGRHTECPRFMVDVQDTSALSEHLELTKHRPETT